MTPTDRPGEHAEDCIVVCRPDAAERGAVSCNCGLVYRQQIWDLKAELAALTESALADEQIHIEVRKEWLAEKGRLEKLAAGLTEQLRMAGIRPYYERRGD